ncbi:cytochrome P450 [Spirulina major]|uniref:cytochrome P450 n=1 Tax=Spirulina major TaxID=270636 RepID=UPI000934D2B2|nr:cytochrome P450 [Spirulina major]
MSIASLPPGPTHPGLWQTLELVRDPIAFFDRYQRQYGHTFTTRVLGPKSPPVVFTGDPEFVQGVFTAPIDTFALGKVTHVFRPLTGDRSLIMLDGAEHLRQRKLLMPPLHGDRMKTYGDLIVAITRQVLAQIPTGQTLDLRSSLADITLQIILRVVFGVEPGPRYDALTQRISALLDAISDPFYSSLFFFPVLQQDLGAWSPWGRFLRQREGIDRLVYAEIRDRRASQEDNPDRADILSLLLTAQDEAGQGMSDRELHDQLMTLLLLGHETTASALAWAILWSYEDRDRRTRLQNEVTDAPPDRLAALPDLNAVCHEALRIYPIALIAQPRIVKEPYALGDYICDRGTVLIPCVYLAHRVPATYPNPTQFNSDRFRTGKFSPAEFFPFGGGHRGCIGMAFSLFEMKLILGTILQQSDLHLIPPDQIRPQRRGITFVPAGGVTMKRTIPV